MAKDKSVGIIPIRKDAGSLSFLLIHQLVGHWAFPKGHPNADETEIETARRELFEETGIPEDAYRVVDGFRYEQHYSFTKDNGEILDKEVVFFLGLVEAPVDIKILPVEVQSFAWLPFNACVEKLTYEDSREMLIAAHKYINEAPLFKRGPRELGYV
ncbi:MAG: NUDIX domain-containing protein [Candidatus Pacebacteria bacterium]|nr:NUDIX domain-containing protein [Candidatus Paceibacterota bacterium]